MGPLTGENGDGGDARQIASTADDSAISRSLCEYCEDFRVRRHDHFAAAYDCGHVSSSPPSYRRHASSGIFSCQRPSNRANRSAGASSRYWRAKSRPSCTGIRTWDSWPMRGPAMSRRKTLGHPAGHTERSGRSVDEDGDRQPDERGSRLRGRVRVVAPASSHQPTNRNCYALTHAKAMT